MFCDEKIKQVYTAVLVDDIHDCDDTYLEYTHGLTYHVKKRNRLVLKTDSKIITMGYDGVNVYPDDDAFFIDEEHMIPHRHEEDEPPWIDFESTLFVGERLVAVDSGDGSYEAVFDDFILKIIPYEDEDDIPRHYNKNNHSYNRVYGCERYLTRHCACGGTGEILLDFVSDYAVRCDQCKKSTWAGMTVTDAINAWNMGETPCDLSDIEIE